MGSYTGLRTSKKRAISKISRVPHSIYSSIIQEFHRYIQSSGCSEKNQNNNLKAIIAFANFIGPDASLYDIRSREQILCYLDTKIKNTEQDPEEKWVTTWNDYLNRIKLFFRWLTNKPLSSQYSRYIASTSLL
jgi:integrase/recombinase XerD